MDLNADNYCGDPTMAMMENREQKKKTEYLEHCLKIQCDFTALVYLVYGIVGEDVRDLEKRPTCLLAKKCHMEYYEMVGLVQSRMSLAMVRSNTILIKVYR